MKEKVFFCEACGNPVSLRASKCGSCGRVFENVKCPKCEYSGKPSLFSNGCPACGYLKVEKAPEEDQFTTPEEGLVSPNIPGTALTPLHSRRTKAATPRKARPFPTWAYAALTIVLVSALIIISIVYIRL